MNKGLLQAFSTGVIFATAIMAGFYYGTNLDAQESVTAADAKKLLEAQGYSISKSNDQSKSEHTIIKKEPKNIIEQKRETKNTEKIEKSEKVISYILKIKSKMTTIEIAKLLEKEKIIDDATEFKNYMNQKNLSRQVQIGEYIVSSNMSNEELGALITHK